MGTVPLLAPPAGPRRGVQVATMCSVTRPPAAPHEDTGLYANPRAHTSCRAQLQAGGVRDGAQTFRAKDEMANGGTSGKQASRTGCSLSGLGTPPFQSACRAAFPGEAGCSAPMASPAPGGFLAPAPWAWQRNVPGPPASLPVAQRLLSSSGVNGRSSEEAPTAPRPPHPRVC